MRLLCLILLPAVVTAQVLRIPHNGQRIGFITSSRMRPGIFSFRNVSTVLFDLLNSDRNDNNIRPSTTGRSNTCTTPEGLQGKCGPLSECEFFIPYLDTVQEPNVLEFFRRRVCRLIEFHFCCPRDPVEQAQPRNKSILPSEEECGQRSGTRIIGGNETAAGSWPWLVTLGLPRADATFFHYCGGTLITRRHVLTAAHCFDPRIPEPTYVRLGEHNLGIDEEGTKPQEIKIKSRLFFGFDNTTFENDIALLVLEQEADFNDFVRPACLPINQPERDSVFDGEQLTVVGWGNTVFGPALNSPVPIEVKVPSTPLDACSNFYQTNNLTVDERNLCAGVLGRDSCQGDSGGPLNYLDVKTGRYYVVGIVSNGRLCGVYPGVYTRVGAFINWILGNLR